MITHSQDTAFEVPVFYDFASAICFVAHEVTAQIEQPLLAAGVRLTWHPVDLTLLSGWQRGDRLAGRRRAGVAEVARSLEVEVVLPDFWMDSRQVHDVALCLAELDQERERTFRNTVWQEVYRHGRVLDDADMAEELYLRAGSSGQPPSDPDGDRLIEATRAAAQLGVVGVPAFLLGDFPVGGIQHPATQLEFLTRWARRERQRRGDCPEWVH